MTTRNFLIYLIVCIGILILLYWYSEVSKIDYDDILRIKDNKILELELRLLE